MRVLVTGGREFLDVAWLFGGLDLLDQTLPGGITEIIEGGARGADIRARWWAEREGERIKLTEVRADWDRYPGRAGILRNIAMADLNPDLVLACPGGPGTAHMVATAKARGIRVVLLEKMPVPRSDPLIVSKLNIPPRASPEAVSAAFGV